MENKAKYTLDQTLIKQYIKHQDDANYQKSSEGNYNLVDYVPDTSVRIWVNNDNVNYALHLHQTVEIIHPLENNYTAYIGSEKYEIKPGEIFIIPSGVPHQLEPPSTPGLRLFFMIDLNVLSKIHGFSYMMAFLSTPTLINYENCGSLYDELTQLLLKMCSEYFGWNVFREVNIYSALLLFLSKYGNHCLSREGNAIPPDAGNNRQKNLSERLTVVFDYLDEHFSEDIPLEKAADIAGFSKFHFSRLFKQCSGHNFYDYLCFRRIKNAETMLMKPGITITEIALQSGFSSLSTFNRTFKKIKDCTPSEYRNLYIKGDYLITPMPEE